MRAALVSAAVIGGGELGRTILKADKRIKVRAFGRWSVIRNGGKKRGRRNRKGTVS